MSKNFRTNIGSFALPSRVRSKCVTIVYCAVHLVL